MVKSVRPIPVTTKQRGRKIAVRYWSINLDSMGRRARLIAVVCAALAAQLTAAYAGAAVPVVESQGSSPSRPASATTSTASSKPSGASANASEVRSYGVEQNSISMASDTPQKGPAGQSSTAETFLRIQQLEADVAELRGIVEEQSHQIDRLTQQQKEQYLDLDRRIALALKGQTSTGASGGTGPDSGPGQAGTGYSGPGSPTGAPAGSGGMPTGSESGNERDAFTAAFELTKQKRFAEAINAFNALIEKYPNGQFAPNSYYWLGECYRFLPDPNLEKSKESFTKVINAYPTNAKASDAMYKLGIVYHELGDRAKALEYLNRVQTQFPRTDAARLAQLYAAELH
jgi:tol-pal system protein YbgF